MREMKLAQLCQRLLKPSSSYGPLMGLDVGTKYIGVAISDSEFRVAEPHSVIEQTGRNAYGVALQLANLVKELSVSGLVVGYPLKMAGFQGQQGPMIHKFVDELRLSECLKDMPYLYWDERLTSKQVEVAIRFVKLDPRRHKQILDKMAAVCILQGCLDSMSKNKSQLLMSLDS